MTYVRARGLVRAYALRGPGEIILYTVLMLFGMCTWV